MMQIDLIFSEFMYFFCQHHGYVGYYGKPSNTLLNCSGFLGGEIVIC